MTLYNQSRNIISIVMAIFSGVKTRMQPE